MKISKQSVVNFTVYDILDPRKKKHHYSEWTNCEVNAQSPTSPLLLSYVISQVHSFSISVLKLAAGLIKSEGDSSPLCCCVIHWSGCCILLLVCLLLLIWLVYESTQTVASSKWSACSCWRSAQLPAEAGEISYPAPITHHHFCTSCMSCRCLSVKDKMVT